MRLPTLRTLWLSACGANADNMQHAYCLRFDDIMQSRRQTGNWSLLHFSLHAGPAVAQAVDRQLDLGRSLQVWLNLQNGVNALFDSTSTSQNLGTQVCHASPSQVHLTI